MEIIKKDKMWLDDKKHTGIRRKTTQSSQGTSYRNSTTNAILPSYYGDEFKAVKEAGDLTQITKAIEGKVIRGKKDSEELVSRNLRQAFSVVDNGFTPMSIMGKEWDKQWATHNERRLVNKGGYGSPVLATEMKWINRANAEESVSVKDFYNILVADRLTKNPDLMVNLATKEELEAAGFEVSAMATPIYRGSKANGGYYDMSAIVPKGADAYSYNSPVYFDENILEGNENLDANIEQAKQMGSFFEWQAEHEKTGISYEDYMKTFGAPKFNPTRVDIHTMNLTAASSDEEFRKFVKNLEKATGAKIAPANLSADVQVYAKRNILRTAGRRVVNYYRVKFNKRSNLLRESYTINYNKNASREEQVYALLSQVAELSTKPFINNTQRLISNGQGYNLPSQAEFSSMKETLGKFSTAMTTAEIAKIVMFNASDAAKIEGLAYLKAAQTLASKPELAENKSLISLASGYTSAALNRCAASVGITLEEYESVTGKKPFSRSHNNSFLGAVFAKQKYSDFDMPKLYEPSGLAKTYKTEFEQNEEIANMFKYLEDVYNKEVAEGKAEEEMAKTLKTFFDWADINEKSGISFEDYAKGLAAKKEKDAKRVPSIAESKKDEMIEMFFKWAQAYQKTGIDIETFAKGFIAKKEKARQKEIESRKSGNDFSKTVANFFEWANDYEKWAIPFENWSGLREKPRQIRASLEKMFDLDQKDLNKTYIKQEKTEKVEKTETEVVKVETKTETAEEVIQGFRKRTRDWALNLRIFKGKEEKNANYSRDVTGLGKTSSVRNAVYGEVCDVINGMNENSLTAEQKSLFKERKGLFPVGKNLSEIDIKKAQKLDQTMTTEIEGIVNDKVEEILTEAAKDDACKTMTGTDVARKHFSDVAKKKSFIQKVKTAFFAPVVKAHNQSQTTLSC